MIGIDIISIHKIKEKSEEFLKKVFSEDEINYAFKKENPYQTLAGIYALKESVIKAYSLSLSYIKNLRIEVKHESNIPYVLIDGKLIDSDVSISHDEDMAIAICINNDEKKIKIPD